VLALIERLLGKAHPYASVCRAIFMNTAKGLQLLPVLKWWIWSRRATATSA
jgi:hypothetical protein